MSQRPAKTSEDDGHAVGSNPTGGLLRRPRRLLVAAALAAVLVGVVVFQATRPGPEPVAIPDPGDVRSSDAFVDSMGVAVQLYQRADEYPLLSTTLGDLGIRHIRTGGAGQRFFRNVNELHTEYGIKTLLVMDPRDGFTGENVVTRGLLPVLDAAEGVEGPNEWDLNDDLEYEGQSWPEGVVNFQDQMWSTMKNFEHGDDDVQRTVRELTVVSPSVADPDATSAISGVRCDAAAMHSYPGGKLPDEDLRTKWIPSARELCGGREVVSTESGWCNTLTPSGCTGQGGVSERASAKYALRHYMEYFRAGVARDYLYNLSTDDWDLFLDADRERKPAFYAVRNLIDLLQDPGTTFHPRRLDVTVQGPEDVHHVILQKRDGSYWLALWTNALSYPNGQECCDLETSRDVTVELPRVMDATTFSPTFAGTEPQAELGTGTSFSLSVPDEVTLVRLTEDPDAAASSAATESTPSAE